MRRPEMDAIETACEWLGVNDGTDGESEACAAVAQWLYGHVRRAEENAAHAAAVRQVVRKTGCTARAARAALAKHRRRSAPA